MSDYQSFYEKICKIHVLNDNVDQLKQIERIDENLMQENNHLLLLMCVQNNSMKCFRFLLDTYNFSEKTVLNTYKLIIELDKFTFLNEMRKEYPLYLNKTLTHLLLDFAVTIGNNEMVDEIYDYKHPSLYHYYTIIDIKNNAPNFVKWLEKKGQKLPEIKPPKQWFW